jgi:hypothetical protein
LQKYRDPGEMRDGLAEVLRAVQLTGSTVLNA